MKNILSLAITLAVLACFTNARAATHTWTGGGSDEFWANPSNWSGGQPLIGEAAPIVVIFTGNVNTTNNINGLVVDSLQFQNTNAVVHGSGSGSLTVRGGNSATNIWFKGSTTLEADLPVSFTGTNLLVVNANNTAFIYATLSGNGGVIWAGGGMAIYRGTVPNFLSGTTWVRDNFLTLDKPAGVNAVAGPLVLEDFISPGPAVTLADSNQIADSAPVTIGKGQTLFAQSFNEKIGSLTFRGGQLNLVNGQLTLGGDILVITNNAHINSPVALGGVTRTITVSNSASLSIVDTVSDGGAASGLNVIGGGELDLLVDNTFTGPVAVTNSTLRIQTPLGLGSAAAGTFINSNSTLSLVGANVAGEALTLAGTMKGDSTNVWNGTVTLQTGADFSVGNNSLINLSGVVSGSAALVKNGGGALMLAGSVANTYSGGTEMNGGLLVLSKTNVLAVPGALRFVDRNGPKEVRLALPNQIANTATVTLTNQSVLNFTNNSDGIGALAGSTDQPSFPALVTLGTGTLTNGGVGITTFGGIITGTGPTALVKNGAGSLTLTGINTCTGVCLLNAGTLTVNGALPGAITQALNTYLTGTGTVGQVTCNSGYVQPAGIDQGTLKTGDLTFNNTAVAFFELGYTTNDSINIIGSVTLNNCTLSVDAYTVGGIGKKFTLIANDGVDAISGTFNGLPEGATVPYGVLNYTISYVGGTGNDVVLTQTTQPQAPQVNAINKQLNGQMTITGHTENGAALDVLAATNLPSTNWVTVGVSYADGFGAFSFTDTNAASFKQRYYRLKMQ